MKRRFSVEQITAVLQQAQGGVPVGDICRQVGISEQTYYRWKKVYGGLQPSEARELKQLRDEHTKLKRPTCPFVTSPKRSMPIIRTPVGRSLIITSRGGWYGGVGLIQSVSDIENVVLAAVNGVPVFVSDVGQVHIGSAPRRGIFAIGKQD